MIINFNELYDIYDNYIRKGYSNKRKLYKFELDKMVKINELCNLVNNGNYSLDNYNIFLITRPKIRIVMSLSLKDKIINHYITLRHIIPTLDKYLDNRNIATRKGYGIDYGIKLVNKYLEKNKKYNKFYILKLDISKYFYNIDHNVLKELIKDKFNKDIFDFLCMIIDSTNKEYINQKIEELSIKYGIEDLPRYNQGKGLGIGNMSSQFFAIYYLYKVDHYIIHTLGLKYYIRYMDDFVIFHHDKEYLKECFKKIKELLHNEYKLELNKKSIIYDISEGFDFLGYTFKIKNNKTIKKISNKSLKSIKSNIKRKDINYNSFSSYMNYKNSYKYCDNRCISNYLNNYFST